MKNILRYIQDSILIFDGAMGTRLSEKGWDMKCSTEILNITKPELIEEVHREYIEAGAKAITTNTFMCNIFNSEKNEYVLEDIIEKSVNIAKKSIGSNSIYIALSCGPSGEFFKQGNKDIGKVYENYKRIAIKGEECGVQVILLETMMHIDEIKIAIKAVKENCKLPIFCTMSTFNGEHEFRGFTVKEMCTVMEKYGCDVIGINCSDSPNHLYKLVDDLLNNSNLPIMIKLNSGSVKIGVDKESKEMEEYFSNDMFNFINKGVRVVGGCCGTNPRYISLIKSKVK